jgi:hypothetical protein
MGLAGGFGSLKQMNDTIKQNRRLLKGTEKNKSKQVREAYREEIKKISSRYENVDLEELKKRVRKKLERNIKLELIHRAFGIGILITLISGVIWVILSFDFTVKKPSPYSDTSKLFNTQVFPHENSEYELRIDFYHHGSKAAESLIKNGLKHQNSESYYPSGEQFRSALYYYDTLVREVYFFKDGDTIKNFPAVDHHKVYQIKLAQPDKKRTIEFYFFDGKIIQDTYREYPYIHSN